MDIIAAWKLAKEGQRIHRKGYEYARFIKDKSAFLTLFKNFCGNDMDDWILSDDWEIIKEKKKVVIENVECMEGDYKNKNFILYCKGNPSGITLDIPMTMTLEWEE